MIEPATIQPDAGVPVGTDIFRTVVPNSDGRIDISHARLDGGIEGPTEAEQTVNGIVHVQNADSAFGKTRR
ncbi:hypothetical protein GCM10007386_30300 [Pseudoduganella dura]|nr:hypothetical protein GCM10007386_30300 [Pseudoduganella dura]